MIYIPKISPIFFRQLVDKPNVSQDLGQQFEAIDYLNFKKYFPLNEVVRFQFMSDSANPDVQITGNCEDYYLYDSNVVVNGDFSSWTAGSPDNWNIFNKGVEDEINDLTNKIQLIENSPYSPRLVIGQPSALTVGVKYVLKINVLELIGKIRVFTGTEITDNYIIEISDIGEYVIPFTAKGSNLAVSCISSSEQTNAIITDVEAYPLVSDIDLTNITPAGWAGDGSYVYEATFTPPTEGNANIYIFEDGELFESEILQFENIDNYIKIGFKNSENDYGYVGSNRLISYYNGDLNEALPGNDIVSYQNDRGELTKLRSTPLEIYKLNIYEVPYYVANQLNLIFSCDDIEINEQTFENEENPNASLIETSNLFNIDIDLTRTNDNYKTETTTDSNYDFDALDSGGIESNNSLIIDSTI